MSEKCFIPILFLARIVQKLYKNNESKHFCNCDIFFCRNNWPGKVMSYLTSAPIKSLGIFRLYLECY